MQIYLIQIYLRVSSPNTVRIFERCKHVFGGLRMAREIEGEAECDFESRSQGDDPASYPKWAPQMQFRKPQIILSFPLRRAGVKVRSWWHFPAGSIRIRHRPKQEPTNLGLNTDPHPSTSSSSLFSSSSSFGFPYFPPQFQSLIITCLLLKHGIISSYVHQDFYTHRLKSHH